MKRLRQLKWRTAWKTGSQKCAASKGLSCTCGALKLKEIMNPQTAESLSNPEQILPRSCEKQDVWSLDIVKPQVT